MKPAFNSKSNFDSALKDLAGSGIHVLAVAPLSKEESEGKAFDAGILGHVALLGNVGSSSWNAFSCNQNYRLSDENPLDSWSKQLFKGAFVGLEQEIYTLFPSDGPPYAPFQTWAFRSGVYSASPVGVAMHSGFGLWTAFRGAVLLPENFFQIADLYRNRTLHLFRGNLGDMGDKPCEACIHKPCLTSCPVSAFSLMNPDGNLNQSTHVAYKVEKCRKFVKIESQCQPVGRGTCFAAACAARRACPVRPDLAMCREQAQFHMQAFVNARPA